MPSGPNSVRRRELGYCDLSFKPDAHLVSVVRRFVSEFYERMLPDREGIERVALATHELLENAIKYSCDGETSIRIEIEEDDDRALVHIKTKNRALPEHITVLRRMVSELQAAEDPFLEYQNVMRRSLLEGDGSRLGLARLRAEADVDMRVDTEDETIVCLVAQTHVAMAEAS